MADSVSYTKYFDLNEIINDIKSYLPNFDSKLFRKAYVFAEKAHRGQFRKDGKTPYLVHPVETVRILVSLHADEDILISALLHDVPEDTSGTLLEVSELFGESISFLVDGITKLSKIYYKHNMPKRELESMKKFFLHSAKDLRVILIKLADRLHNMKTLENIDDAEKRLRIAGETLEIYVPIANLLGIHSLKIQLETYCFKNLFPIEYEALSKNLENRHRKQNFALKKFISSTEKMLKTNNIDAMVMERDRSLYRIYKKLCVDGLSIDEVDVRFSIQIIVNTIPECYQTLGIIHGAYTPNPGRLKDYIANPKPNEYQSIHTTVFGVNGIDTRVQILTHSMYLNAEYGVAAHFFSSPFKGRKKDRSLLKDKRSSWVNKVIAIDKKIAKDGEGAFLEDLKLDIFQDRIIAFTPKGDPIDLPKGACVLDFAYAIHSDIGHHASKGEINNRNYPVNHTLRTGDVINIKTSKDINPDIAWLSFIHTNVAKNNIKAYLKRATYKDKTKKGREILQKAFDIDGLGPCESMSFRKIRKIINQELGFGFEKFSDLFVAISEARISAIDVVKILKNHKTRLGGFFNRFSDKLKYNVRIVTKNRFGLVPIISKPFYKYASDVTYMKGWSSRSQKYAYFTLQIVVDDIAKIGKIFDELKQIEEVKSVYRVSYQGLVLFYILMIFTIFVWVLHPTLLNRLSTMEFALQRPWFLSYLVNIGLLVLGGSVLYLRHIAQRYLPAVRTRTFFLIGSFATAIIAMFTLFLEIYYYNLQLNWIALGLELILIYGYLIMNYIHLRKT